MDKGKIVPERDIKEDTNAALQRISSRRGRGGGWAGPLTVVAKTAHFDIAKV